MPLTQGNHFRLDNKTYDFVKKLVQIVLPATSSLYFGLASIWGLPGAEQVVGTLAVVATFLGVVIGISVKGYNASGAAYDGQMVVSGPEEGPKRFTLELDMEPEELARKDAINFQVVPRDEDVVESYEDAE